MQNLNQPRNFQASHLRCLRRVSEAQGWQREVGGQNLRGGWRMTPRTRPLLMPALLLLEIPAPSHHGWPRGQEAPGKDGGKSLGAEWQRGTDR